MSWRLKKGKLKNALTRDRKEIRYFRCWSQSENFFPSHETSKNGVISISRRICDHWRCEGGQQELTSDIIAKADFGRNWKVNLKHLQKLLTTFHNINEFPIDIFSPLQCWCWCSLLPCEKGFKSLIKISKWTTWDFSFAWCWVNGEKLNIFSLLPLSRNRNDMKESSNLSQRKRLFPLAKADE